MSLQAGATALKRHDPFVHYAGLSYAWPRARHIAGTEVEPGDTLGVQIGFGTILTRSAMLNLSGDFRVTGNVPNFRLNASLPIRF